MRSDRIPYNIDAQWKIESGQSPKLFCRGCGEKVEDDNGFNTQHDVLDCLKAINKRVRALEGRGERGTDGE